MLKELRKRFILFNILIITGVLLVLAFAIFFGSDNHPPVGRVAPMLVFGALLVLAASLIISKLALQPVKRAWQQQLDFTADASHELRTPLAVIKTNLEIVMDCPEETVASQMQWLCNIEAEHARMTKLVEDLLTLSRADTGEQHLLTAGFALDETVRAVTHTFRPLCAQKGIELEQQIETGIAFDGDETRLTQLVVILLDNAIQYTPAGGRIGVELRRKERGTELVVRDTGAGIAAADQAKVFDRFYRAANTRQWNPDGSGLGLAIAKWIVEQHKGSIAVSGKLGEGSTFTVNFRG